MRKTIFFVGLLNFMLIATSSLPAYAATNVTVISGLSKINRSVELAVTNTSRPVASPAMATPIPTPAEQPRQHVVVEVNEGESLTIIAESQNTSVQRIYDVNPDIDNPDFIVPGQKIKIPFADEATEVRTMPAPVVATPAPAVAYTVSAPVYRSAPAPAPVVSQNTSDGGVWDQIAACESGGNWAINTGNGFYGGVQFTLASWAAVGGSGYPNQASKDEQIMRANMLLARQGWGAWPACSSKLGLR